MQKTFESPNTIAVFSTSKIDILEKMKKLLLIISAIILAWLVITFFYDKSIQWYCNDGMTERGKNITKIATQDKISNQQLKTMESDNVKQYIHCLNQFGIKAWFIK